MRILLFGTDGQVGWELQRSLSYLGDLFCVGRDHPEYEGDFLDPNGLVRTVEAIKPDVIVNAAAYTAVDKAETDQETAFQINTHSVLALAKAAERHQAWLIHYSTDYVYDGAGDTARDETTPTSPINVYGETKQMSEQVIQRYCSRYLIFRTSWVYANRGNNFAKTMLTLAKSRRELSIVDDQIGAPTSAELLADCTAHAIRKAYSLSQTGSEESIVGIYHLVAKAYTSWYHYANFVFDIVRKQGIDLTVETVEPVPSSHYPTAAARPHNSRLDVSKFEQSFGLTLPTWQCGVERMIKELTEV
ncbi:dTDP-4-dehydrorhamnose reductase [Salinivibrio sp. MA427]|uniref:dTDP-4-dehydrorhamnose reductase n=1 Tax=Salinivibrio sp. MA427 TaxID=1909455 RepID=UPI000989CF03|nr:dTDP-4-dehydrorhamnose reductase [Salinivibrio sp. MA427]OOF10620.1 dTDP-4-dehydrorhamnose reductase [Salinivibrio sp. MA427]